MPLRLSPSNVFKKINRYILVINRGGIYRLEQFTTYLKMSICITILYWCIYWSALCTGNALFGMHAFQNATAGLHGRTGAVTWRACTPVVGSYPCLSVSLGAIH